MLQKQSVAGLYKGDVMCNCDSVRITEPWCRIEGDMWCVQLMWTKCDVTDGADVKMRGPLSDNIDGNSNSNSSSCCYCCLGA